MTGKGDDRRPTQVDPQTFADNWDRVFKRKTRFTEFRAEDYLDSPEAIAAYEAELAKDDLLGSGVTGSAPDSNSGGPRSSLGSPANKYVLDGLVAEHGCIGRCGYCEMRADVYINADTGEQVTEDWWPEITR